MLLKDYLNRDTQRRRILIVSDMSKGQPLERLHESEEKNIVKNINYMTLEMMAKQIVIYEKSVDGYVFDFEMLENKDAVMLFRKLIFDNLKHLKFFNDEKMINLSTAKEILDKVNLIRANGFNGKEEKISSERIADLKLLLKCYESFLADKKLFDTVEQYRYAIAAIEKWDDPKDVIEDIYDADISYLVDDSERYNGLELKLLKLILGDENLSDDGNKVVFCDAAGDGAKEKNIDNIDSGKVAFFKGYGSFNEANYIANDIISNNNPFGKVTVLYNSPSQYPAIVSALSGNGIKMRGISEHPIGNNEFIALTKRIMNWALEDFSEKALNEVMLSPVICTKVEIEETESSEEDKEITELEGTDEVEAEEVEAEEIEAEEVKTEEETTEETEATEENSDIKADKTEAEKKDKKKSYNVIRGQYYFNHVLDARNRFENRFKLGWGYERNIEFIKHERKLLKSDDKRLLAKNAVFKLHESLIDIFGENGKLYDEGNKVLPGVMCGKLIDFINNYTSRRESYAIGIDALKRVKNALRFEEKALTYKDNIAMITELLDEASASDDASFDAVSVKSLFNWSVLERPYVYVTGLSLEQMQGNTTQSPVFNDDEMEVFLGEGFKPTIKNKLINKENNVYRTLMTFKGEKISFGYSFYDTARQRETSPSGFYRDMLSLFDNKEICGFEYGNPTEDKILLKKTAVDNPKADDILLKTSSSKLEDLLGCPKKYAYGSQLYIPQNDFVSFLKDKMLEYFDKVLAPIFDEAEKVFTEYSFSFIVDDKDRDRFKKDFGSYFRIKEKQETEDGKTKNVDVYPLEDFDGTIWVNGKSDLIVRQKDGKVKVYDYKSDAHNGKPMDKFLKSMGEKYEGQLKLYSYAIGKSFGASDVETELIHLYL